MTDPADGAAVVRSYLDAVSVLDVAGIVATFHEEIVLLIPYAPDGIPRIVEGKPAAAEWFAGLPGLVAPMRFADHDIQALQQPGEFVAEYTSDSTVLPTGLPYRNRYISRFTVRDGLVVRAGRVLRPRRARPGAGRERRDAGLTGRPGLLAGASPFSPARRTAWWRCRA